MKLQVWNSEHLSFFGVLPMFFKCFPGDTLTAAIEGSRGCVTLVFVWFHSVLTSSLLRLDGYPGGGAAESRDNLSCGFFYGDAAPIHLLFQVAEIYKKSWSLF